MTKVSSVNFLRELLEPGIFQFVITGMFSQIPVDCADG